MRASVTFSESGGKAPIQEGVATQGRKGTPTLPSPAAPRGGEIPTQEREDTAVQQPTTASRIGGLDPLLLIGLRPTCGSSRRERLGMARRATLFINEREWHAPTGTCGISLSVAEGLGFPLI